ncbi:MAG: putative toxin-antitoxin system toxin component, PIN family [Acidobacteria bacterium]|nr:putative toxin-antitoxin system toxin component, PIN family [Acidobacteriota bacterium]
MIVAVLDSTILISAFLTPNGADGNLVLNTPPLAFSLYLSFEIVEETKSRLLNRVRLRKRYDYTNGDVERYANDLYTAARFVVELPTLQAVRDPNDDFVLATAVKAQADYLVAYDNDLLALKNYHGIEIVTAGDFLRILRGQQ